MKKIIFTLMFILLFNTNLVAKDSSSKISLRNVSPSTTHNVTGIYVQKLATESSCNALAGNTNTPAHGFAYGMIWRPTKFSPSEMQTLGANFLYQMMHQLLHQTYLGSGSDCVPGTGKCTMFTDDPTTDQWCIQLGIVKGLPMLIGNAISAGNDLLSAADSIEIKITCNDAAAECTANTPVTQNFP